MKINFKPNNKPELKAKFEVKLQGEFKLQDEFIQILTNLFARIFNRKMKTLTLIDKT